MSYLPPLLRSVQALGYAVFDGPRDFDLNLVAVRSKETHRKPDLYLDDMHVIWKEGGHWRQWSAACTTSPGAYYLAHPMRPSEGCAIMAPGQYRGAYKRGLHKGTECLRQHRPVSFYRDNDRDGELDLDESTLRKANTGLHIHRGGRSDRVGKYSAGCQVLHPNDMLHLVKLCDAQISHNPGWDTFTYTLLDEAQL